MNADVRRATRFFWVWLLSAAGASVAGNIAHAVLATPDNAWIAALAAVVPPAVLLGAMHGVGQLVRARTLGTPYRVAMVTTGLLALLAFILSFDALRNLAEQWAGYDSWTSWLWPLAIDLSITNSTIALLALTGRTADAPPQHHAPDPERPVALPEHSERDGAPPVYHNGASVHLDAPPTHIERADALVRSGTVNLDPEKVSEILAALDNGVAPSTIARAHQVGYQTVLRIRDAHQRITEKEDATA